MKLEQMISCAASLGTLKISENYFMNRFKIYSMAILVTLFCIQPLVLFSQPSGGPYGPIARLYHLPKVSGKMIYAATDGKKENLGETLSNPTTIESAIKVAKTGDAIILRGGIYRTGNLVFNQGITIQPYADEQPIVKGTLIASNWKNLGNGLWTTSWPNLFPSKPADWWRRNREGKKTPVYRFNNDMVFVDGKFLQAVGWEGEVDENSYYIDYEKELVYIGTDPANKLIEITAHDAALIRTTKDFLGRGSDKKGPVIRGITFTQYAYRAIEIEGTEPDGISAEANHGKDVIGTTLEDCTISYCSRVAGYFRGDHLTIKHCKVSDTSTEGIYVIASSDVLLEKNIFTRNNIERITGYYPAAVKIFNQCYRVTCLDNLVIDLPYSNGIWYDVGNVDGRFLNNWVEKVGNKESEFSIEQPWPSDNGFFFEISKGAICAGNVFIDCDHGLWVLNGSGVQIFNNTFVNSTACIARNARTAAGDHFGWHPSTGPDIDKRDNHVFVNNLLTGDMNFNRPLLYIWQPAAICGTIVNSQLKELDYNVFVRGASKVDSPLIIWSPVKNEKCQALLMTLKEFQVLKPEFLVHGKSFPDYSATLFKSPELGNYQLLESFPGSDVWTKLPAEISKLLGQSKEWIGAYPSVK